MFKKKVFKVISFLSLSLLFLLTSCENFLSGKQLKDELDSQIEFANFPEINIRVMGDDSINFISGSGDFKLKPTENKEIEFELVSDDYYFVNWTIVEKNSPENDASSFVDISVTINNNLYKTTITLKKDSPDLLLKPITKLKPGISYATPIYYPAGVYLLKPINLYFTQPMNKSDLENWTHIDITDKNGNSIKNNFNTPELSESGTIVTIRPIQNKIINLLKESQTFEIKVTVDGGLSDVENSKFTTKPFTHNYVINNQIDNTPPVLTEINVFKEIIDFDTREKTLTSINQNAYAASWSDAEFENHHTSSTIYIDCTGTDSSSGVKELKVTETLIMKKNGTAGSGTTSATAATGSFIEKTNGVFVADTFKYNLSTASDGVIQLDFELIGYNDKVSNKKTIYVVKQTEKPVLWINTSSDLRLPKADGTDVIEDIADIGAYSEFYSNLYDPVSVKITYWDEGDENNVKTFVPTTVYKPENHQTAEIPVTWYSIVGKGYKIVRNPKKTTKVKMVAETKYGITNEKIFTIPKSISINFDGTIGTNTVPLSHPSLYYNTNYYYQEKQNVTDNYGQIICNNSNNNIPVQEDYIYKVYLSYCENNGDFYSCAADTLEFKFIDWIGGGAVRSIGENTNVYGSSFPEIGSRDYIEGPVNSGICYAKYNYQYRGNEKFNFRLCFEKYESGNVIPIGTLFADGLDDYVILETGYLYIPYFIAYDKYGFELDNSLDVEKSYRNYRIDTTNVHNKAPNITSITLDDTLNNATSPTSPRSATFIVLNTVDSNLEQKLYYYIVKNTDGLNKMPYSEELLTSLKEYTFETESDFIAKGAQIPVPIEILENGYYTIFLKIKDKYGNYSINSNFHSSFVNGEIDVSTIKRADASNINMPFTNPLGSKAYYFDATNKQWTQNSNFVSTTKTTNNYVLKKGSSYTNQFVKVDSYTAADRIGLYHNYNKTVYLCPDYFINNRTIKNKGVMELSNGYQFFIDQPTFVRVLYSKTNWGEDADLWGTRGFETDCRVESSSFTYIPNTSEVPEGYYYCTVAHFADGTSTMGDIYQK